MNILEYHPRLSYYTGGGERITIEQIKHLAKTHNITVLTTKNKFYTEMFRQLFKSNIKINFVDNAITYDFPHTGSEWDKESVRFGTKVNEFINGYDLVITHYTMDSLFLHNKINNILHLHGVAPKIKKVDTYAIKRADAIVGVSKSVVTGWKKYYKMHSKPVKIIYNGIDTERFIDMGLKRDIDILYIGRLEPHKGLDTLIYAIKTLNNKNIKVIIAGTGSDSSRLKKIVDDLDIKIEFVDYVKEIDLIRLYNRAVVFVHPAYEQEGSVLTVNEAAACGCIRVVSNCCGMIEEVNTKTGYLFIPKDYRDLARKLQYALEYKNDKKISIAKKIIKSKFSINSNIKQLSEFYEKINKK